MAQCGGDGETLQEPPFITSLVLTCLINIVMIKYFSETAVSLGKEGRWIIIIIIIQFLSQNLTITGCWCIIKTCIGQRRNHTLEECCSSCSIAYATKYDVTLPTVLDAPKDSMGPCSGMSCCSQFLL